MRFACAWRTVETEPSSHLAPRAKVLCPLPCDAESTLCTFNSLEIGKRAAPVQGRNFGLPPSKLGSSFVIEDDLRFAAECAVAVRNEGVAVEANLRCLERPAAGQAVRRDLSCGGRRIWHIGLRRQL